MSARHLIDTTVESSNSNVHKKKDKIGPNYISLHLFPDRIHPFAFQWMDVRSLSLLKHNHSTHHCIEE